MVIYQNQNLSLELVHRNFNLQLPNKLKCVIQVHKDGTIFKKPQQQQEQEQEPK